MMSSLAGGGGAFPTVTVGWLRVQEMPVESKTRTCQACYEIMRQQQCSRYQLCGLLLMRSLNGL